MLDKIKELVAHPNYHKINFEYQDLYGRIGVECTIRNHRLNFIPVQGTGWTEEEALEGALATLAKIEASQVKIGAPQETDQKYYNGYYRRMINDEIEVEFKNKRVTEYNGFIVDDLHYIDKTENINNITYDLYEWDNIGYLCGSSGKVLIKDGLVYASKTEFIS